MTPPNAIPEQARVPWATALIVSWAGLKRRVLRSMITMVGVILAIAFLSYMLTTARVTEALVLVGDPKLDLLLQEAGVDTLAKAGTNRMQVLLIGLSLLTCTVGVVNAMMMSVTERIREIGTLKCLGARDEFILKTYFIESSLQGLCGSCAGMALGFLVALGAMSRNFGVYVFRHFPWVSVTEALITALVCGAVMSVIAAIAPAFLAARRQPVDALRVEE